MKPFSIALGTLGLAALLAPAPAGAQSRFDLRPGLTTEEFKAFTADLAPVLRFRQLGDPTTLGKGKVDVGMQFASNLNDGAFPRFVARIGVSDRVDVGAWGGLNAGSNYGVVGADTKIALMTQGPSRPVSIAIRPSITSLVGPSEVWVGNASIDLSVSRAFGAVSPYAGVATTGSLAIERSHDVDLDPATTEGSVSYAGVSYRWKRLIVSGEVEKGTQVSYGFRLGTRF